MKKMIVLTLALSVMMVGSAMANSSVEARKPERVKIDVRIGDRHCGNLMDALHVAFCPECSAHLKHRHTVCDGHRPHPPKMRPVEHRGGKGHPLPPRDGKGDDKGGKPHDDKRPPKGRR